MKEKLHIEHQSIRSISPYHVDSLQDGTINQCMNSVCPDDWSPFAGGNLTGRY